MGKVKQRRTSGRYRAWIVSIPYGKGKVKTIKKIKEYKLEYQFPMGKVKVIETINANQTEALYQFPMGKVKRQQML